MDIDYKVHSVRFDTPEARGELFKARASASYGSVPKITLAEVAADIIFNEFDSVSEDTYLEKSAAIGYKVDMGLSKSFDVLYRNVGDSPFAIGLKYQIIGKSELENETGFKAAVIVSGGVKDGSEGSISIINNAGDQTREYDGELEVELYDLSLLMGYRFNKNGLIYLNNYYSYYESIATLSSTNFATSVSNGILRSYGSLLGIKYNANENKIFVMLEAGICKTSHNSTIEKTIFPVGATFGVSW